MMLQSTHIDPSILRPEERFYLLVVASTEKDKIGNIALIVE